jgi:heme O synthase-like polyprenyltransferase
MGESAQQANVADLTWWWVAVLLPPFVWAVQMALLYALQPWFCSHAAPRATADLISLVAAVITVAGGALAWRRRRALSPDTASQPDRVLARAWFMASLSILLCALFVLAIIAQWIPNHLLSPCPL